MLELLRQRRSIRKYKNKKIGTDTIEKLKESLVRSPTSRNLHSWNFILIDDESTLVKLSKAKEQSSSFLKRAPLGIVICGDESVSDVWIEDCSIASIIAQLTAQSLGLGSCWIQIRNRNYNDHITSEDYIKRLLKLPGKLKVESIIAIGYPDEEKKSIPVEKLKYNKIRIVNF